MFRAMMIIGGGALLAALIIYALIDCARTDALKVRGVPKTVWFLIIVVFPIIGALLWLFLGKQPQASSSFGTVKPKAPQAPDDDVAYLRYLDARAKREADSRRREEEREAELDAKIDEELKKLNRENKEKPEDGSADE